ncbi:hypothetical protein FB451DRAFT_1535529 [Mycena latifolia]|nr:hypothetical protein FB451DRAFT_1535529 [Mycena latifolia]
MGGPDARYFQRLYAVGAMRRHPRSGVCNAGCPNLDIRALVRRAFFAQPSTVTALRAPRLLARRHLYSGAPSGRSAPVSPSVLRCVARLQRRVPTGCLSVRAGSHTSIYSPSTYSQAGIAHPEDCCTHGGHVHPPLPERVAAAPPACLLRGLTDSRLRHFSRDRLLRRCATLKDISVVDHLRAQRAIPGASTVQHERAPHPSREHLALRCLHRHSALSHRRVAVPLRPGHRFWHTANGAMRGGALIDCVREAHLILGVFDRDFPRCAILIFLFAATTPPRFASACRLFRYVPGVEGGDGPLVAISPIPIFVLSLRYIGHRARYLFLPRVVHRGYGASEHPPPEPYEITLSEPLRATPVPHACKAYSPIDTLFSFYASTTFWGLSTNFLFHPCTPYPGLPTHLSVYQPRTRFFDTGSADSPVGP